MKYGDSYDMHICFYGDHATVENVDYEVSFDIPHDCGITELTDLLKIAQNTLLQMERALLEG